MALRIFRFRRFSTQLLLLVAGLFAAVQFTVYLFISEANEETARKHIEDSLKIGAEIFRQNLKERIEFLAAGANVMSTDAAIKQLLAQEPLDRNTLRSVLASYTDRVKAPVITIYSAEGELLAATDEVLGQENVRPFGYLIRLAAEGDMDQVSGYSYLDGKLHVLVVVPLYAPRPIVGAWFGLAYPIDKKLANDIKNTTRLDVTFTSNPDEPDVRVLSTTLNPAMAEAVARYTVAVRDASGNTIAVRNASGASEMLSLGGEPYVTLFESLDLLGEDPARVALQRSLNMELVPARQLEQKVLQISLGALFAATVVAFGIARSVSRPMQQLAQHTKLVAAGDYTQRIDLPREDELGQLASAFNHMTTGLAERDRVRSILGMVVSPEIATQLVNSNLELGGEERQVTILFCDLRDFTSFSEKMSPTEVLALLNRYLDRMSGIIERHGGVIDKYIGDAIMALFGAPVDAPEAPARAVTAAREMVAALESLNAELRTEDKPVLAFGIGINTARVVAGMMGSKKRANYTIIGDGVNLASRLEGLTKEYGTPIIVSEATLAGITPRPIARELGEVKVKGKSNAVKIFALTAPAQPGG